MTAMSHAVIWPLPGDGEETEVRLFPTDEAAVTWAGEHCPTGGWQYAAVVDDVDTEPYRRAIVKAIADLTGYSERGGEDAHVGPLAVLARLTRDLADADRSAR